MRVKLTDAQLEMMSAAAQREDHCLTPPETMKGAAVGKVSAKLLKLVLVREIRAKAGMPVWRRDEAGLGFALKLTAAGLKAIAVDEERKEAIEPIDSPQLNPRSGAKTVTDLRGVGEHDETRIPRKRSKLARVIDLLRRFDGATILQLTEETGWLPHTTRAALTGLRKRGYPVVRERAGVGDSIYRISGAAADGEDGIVVRTNAASSHDDKRKPKAKRAA
jgi:hypothetical protein